MRPRSPSVLALALLLSIPACNCGHEDPAGSEGSAPTASAGGPAVRGDPGVLEVVERLGDQGAAMVVVRPEGWAAVRASLRPWLDAAPSLAGAAESLPRFASAMLSGSPEAMELGGWDPSRPVVASLGEVPYGGPPGAVTPLLPVREGWMPPVRHQLWVPAKDPAALVASLATTIGAKAWPELVEGREGARGLDLEDERAAVALLPEAEAVRVVVFQSGGGLVGDARLEHLRGRLDAEAAEPEATPALSLLAQPDGMAAGWVRPWRMRALAAWLGAMQVLEALHVVATDQRSVLLARGMQIVLGSELLMTDAGAELDDLAVSLVADEGMLRLRMAASLTPEGETIFAAGLDEAPELLVTKAEDAWLELALRLDARAALDATEPPPAFARAERLSEVAEALQDGGSLATLYVTMRHPMGMLRMLDGWAEREHLLVSLDPLPTSLQLVWQGMDRADPRGGMALQWPEKASTSSFDSLVDAAPASLSLRRLATEHDGRPVTLLSLGREPTDVFDPTKTHDDDALLELRMSLTKTATMLPASDPMTGLVRGDVAMRWEQRGKALVGELVWAPEGAPRGEAIEHAKVPLSARGSWRSPMGPKVDEAAAECLRQGGQVLSQGLSAATTMERDRLGLALAKVLVEAEPSLACAAKDEDTAAAAAGLRRMAVELTADVMMGAHQYEAALSMLSTQCELSKDEALCRRAKEQAALPRPKTPEIDWAMVCDPDYGMPAGDLVVRMDASGIAIDGASVSPSELGPRTEVVVAAAARAEDAFIDEIPPPPPPLGIGAPIPETKAVAELSLDASLTMEQVRPVLRALLDAGVTDVLLPVTGTRRSEGALPAKLVAEAPPPPPVGAPPSSPSVGVLGLMAPPTGEELARELAIFEVAKGTVTTRSTLRPEPQAHTAPSMSLLRDHMDGALVVYVIAADDSSWSEVAAVVGAACPQAAIVLAPHAP
ncbi:MAG: hypothetical protein KC501_31390 [Myxococcales bacterium]|nr:hypothetical protein [Myxococcales bacterium]